MFESIILYFERDFIILFKVLFALLMGLIVGLERQRMQKSAGMRTHIIVCVSTTMVVAVAMAAFPAADSGARAIAAVITGIGFLGAGQIMTTGGKISGITTAASIWANALIGCVIGLGFYLIAFVSTMIMFYTFRMKRGSGWTR